MIILQIRSNNSITPLKMHWIVETQRYPPEYTSFRCLPVTYSTAIPFAYCQTLVMDQRNDIPTMLSKHKFHTAHVCTANKPSELPTTIFSTHSNHFFSKTLTTLGLDRNSIGDERAKHLGDALKTNHVSPQLSSLFHSRLSHPSQTLTTLNLYGNSIDDEGAKHLSDALRTNQVSRQLSSLFYSRLSHPSQTLTTLNLEDNSIGDEGAKHLGDALKTNHVSPQLSSLFDSRLSHLSQTLTTLNLYGNSIGDEGAKQLGECIYRTNQSKSTNLPSFSSISSTSTFITLFT